MIDNPPTPLHARGLKLVEEVARSGGASGEGVEHNLTGDHRLLPVEGLGGGVRNRNDGFILASVK